VNEFQLVFRGADGEGDQTEYQFNDTHGEPRIDGRLVADGETYTIRGTEWLLKQDNSSTAIPRFICTLVVEPVEAA
jgi:hypothetical protein